MVLTNSTLDDHPSRTPSLAEKLITIRQMLATLDTLTIAGQRHLMSKVAAFIGSQFERALLHVGAGNRRTLLEQLAFLRREADRPIPSISVFGARAENLLLLLGGPVAAVSPEAQPGIG